MCKSRYTPRIHISVIFAAAFTRREVKRNLSVRPSSQVPCLWSVGDFSFLLWLVATRKPRVRPRGHNKQHFCFTWLFDETTMELSEGKEMDVACHSVRLFLSFRVYKWRGGELSSSRAGSRSSRNSTSNFQEWC